MSHSVVRLATSHRMMATCRSEPKRLPGFSRKRSEAVGK
jgi:hypothetical protein